MAQKYFYFDENPYYPGKYGIYINHDLIQRFFPNGTRGSYGVLCARLLNLSYADFLRYCRDRVGGELIGKNRKYVYPIFDKTDTARMLLKLLNTRMEYVISRCTHPYEYKREGDGTITQIPLEVNESNT